MVFDYFYVVEEVGVDFVYFVDEYDLWNFVMVGLVLYGFGLWFDVCVGVKKVDCFVKYC